MKGQTDRHMDRQTDESDLIGGCSTDVEPPIQINIYRNSRIKRISMTLNWMIYW